MAGHRFLSSFQSAGSYQGRSDSRSSAATQRTRLIGSFEKAIAAAHMIGKHGAAFGYALQFETTARQWDIIGQWVPLADPRPSAVTYQGKKWIGPTWAAIDANLVLTLTPTKTERSTNAKIHVDLSRCPMVVEELALIPQEARSGPLVVNEANTHDPTLGEGLAGCQGGRRPTSWPLEPRPPRRWHHRRPDGRRRGRRSSQDGGALSEGVPERLCAGQTRRLRTG